ncbi:MAG: HigA family addiction module antitoxin [Acidobacteriota bacterium]|nr:HigA family addiction module antitoxin [Acidobacteriota bacterium]
MEMFNPPHPGAALREFMGEELTVSELAVHVKTTRANLSMLLNGRLGISAAMAVKLSEAFPNSSAQFWLNLQNNYDLAQVRKKKRAKILPVLRKAA